MEGFPLKELLEQYPKTIAAIVGSIVLVFLLLLLSVWLAWGRGPRRRRAMRAARKLLDTGNWKGALDQLKAVRAIGSPSASWCNTFDLFEVECLQAASVAALKDKKFEDALTFGLQAARLRDEPEQPVRTKVQSAMVQEIRRLFAKTGETEATINMVVRTLQVQAPCREATFWQAMCEVRLGALEPALKHLQVARLGIANAFSLDEGSTDSGSTPTSANGEAAETAVSPFLDPPLYLGALLLRMGRAKDALRYLTEANRMDANCPFIRLQLGAAIVTAGGDTNMAVRALQFALGPKGLGQYLSNPDRAWVGGFPENRSYVRKLAEEFPFTCPLFGEDMKYLLHQGNLALAQGQFKLGNYQESAELFDKVLKEGAPSLAILRGLGLSLAKLGRYDDAFVHLRTAHEMEEMKDRLTAGYLALCGAAGKPARPEDRLQNMAWALRLVTQFNAPGDPEWLGLLNRIFAEARRNAIPLTSDDQVYLCEHLVSGKAHDPLSAEAFHHLLTTEPALVHPEYAWLYCKADDEHKVGGSHVLALYTRTFADQDAARAFFTAQGWDLDRVELMFLRRAAEKGLGRFPEVLGSDYLPRGERILLAEAARLEEAGQPEVALETIEVLVKLSPNNTSAMDRAAGLHYRAGRLEPAFELLDQWRLSQPLEPMPLVRQAILRHQQGDNASCFERLRFGMKLASGRRRANIAFLGARLALQGYLLPRPGQPTDANALPVVLDFLRDCLTNNPDHPAAAWCLAGVRWLQGDTAALVAQASLMVNTDAADGRYHYFAALCHLLGGEFEVALAACQRVTQQVGANGSSAQRALGLETSYLAGLAQVGRSDLQSAIEAFKPVTYNAASPTLCYAQGQLASAYFREKRLNEAIAVWEALDASKRQAWSLADPLAQAMFINALESLQQGHYEQAAEKFRQSGRLGYRDRRLGPLLLLALFKAGQQAIYAGETAPVTPREEIPSPKIEVPPNVSVASTP